LPGEDTGNIYREERKRLHDDSIPVLEEGDHGEEAHEDFDGAEDERYDIEDLLEAHSARVRVDSIRTFEVEIKREIEREKAKIPYT